MIVRLVMLFIQFIHMYCKHCEVELGIATQECDLDLQGDLCQGHIMIKLQIQTSLGITIGILVIGKLVQYSERPTQELAR